MVHSAWRKFEFCLNRSNDWREERKARERTEGGTGGNGERGEEARTPGASTSDAGAGAKEHTRGQRGNPENPTKRAANDVLARTSQHGASRGQSSGREASIAAAANLSASRQRGFSRQLSFSSTTPPAVRTRYCCTCDCFCFCCCYG